MLFALSAWIGFFGFGWYGPRVAWISETCPRANVGATLGLAMAINQVAIVVTPILFGLTVDVAGVYLPAWLALMVMTLIYIAYAWMHLQLQHSGKENR